MASGSLISRHELQADREALERSGHSRHCRMLLGEQLLQENFSNGIPRIDRLLTHPGFKITVASSYGKDKTLNVELTIRNCVPVN
jgi:hypothetical protein